MEVMEDFGINVHAIITVQDIYEYLKQDSSYGDILTKNEGIYGHLLRFLNGGD